MGGGATAIKNVAPRVASITKHHKDDNESGLSGGGGGGGLASRRAISA